MHTLGLQGIVTGTCVKASHGALFHGSIRSDASIAEIVASVCNEINYPLRAKPTGK